MDFTIRTAREEDAASMVALLNPIIRAGNLTIMDEECTPDSQREFIRSFPERGILHVAVDSGSGDVLGLQEIFPMPSELYWLRHVGEIGTFVSLDAHRRGIGKSLMRETLRAAAEKGFRKINATIRADNPRALSFYTSQGFRIIGTAERHALVRSEYIDEILTERLLD